MTILHYRGRNYERKSVASTNSTQLRYDRSVISERRQDVAQDLTYRGCRYTSGQLNFGVSAGDFHYRGVAYSH